MCGIAGILFPSDAPDHAKHRVASMRDALAHRGPDGHGLYQGPDALLTHTRLALVDIEHGEQPIFDAARRYSLTFNGEIYNHRELRCELPSYPFKTNSDSETLLAALITWGEEALPRLDGMFAFAFWDSTTKTGLLARDALGVKPLVYGTRGGEFVFASEAQAILASGWERSYDEDALVEYLVAPAFSGVRTSMFRGLEHLPAGHVMTVTRDTVPHPRPWYRYRVPSTEQYSESALVECLQDALHLGVKRALRADVPVGIFLSGGLDSTILAYLAALHSDDPPHAFTLRFQEQENIVHRESSIVLSDDAPFVEHVREALDLPLAYADLRHDEMIRDWPRLCASNDRIPAWEQEFGQDALARSASGARKAVLVGDAADETHFGYFFLLDDKVTASPTSLMERFGASERVACLSPTIQKIHEPLRKLDSIYREVAATADTSFSESENERRRAATSLISKLWLGRLLHNGDSHTMAHGVEARVPFASTEMLRVAQRITPEQGFAGGIEKAVLRKACKARIPASIASRKKSALPFDPRLGPRYQRELLTLLDAEPDFAHALLNVRSVRSLCEGPVYSEIHRSQLFHLVSLFHWKQQHLG